MLGKFTDIIVLLDESGSMGGLKNATLEAYNGYIAQHKDVNARITLATFNSITGLRYVLQDVPSAEAPELTAKDYKPNSGTPLRDAFGQLLDERGALYASLPEASRPENVLFVVQTDGEENASHKVEPEALRLKIKVQTDVYKWVFVYLGANQDAFHVADGLGIARGMTVPYTSNAASTKNMMNIVGGKSASYSSGGASAGSFVSFTEQELQKSNVPDDLTPKP